MMRTIVFDVSGPYGHFRKPYAPASPVTYPFPPPPTVLGMMGAIVGLAKDRYHEALAWDKVRIAIKIKRPVRVFRTAINLVNTKDAWGPVASRLQVPHEFLRDPAFRIYVAGLPEAYADRLASLLESGQTEFTPSLGLAQCLAETGFVADTAARAAPEATAAVSVMPAEGGVEIEYEPGRRYERVRVAVRMGPDRSVHQYRQAVAALDGDDSRPVRVRGAELFEVNHETIAFF